MTRLIFIITLSFLAISTQAIAHIGLASSVPVNGAEVTMAKEVVLDFEGEVRLTSVGVRAVGGEEIPLGEIPAGMAKNFTIALPERLAGGNYVVTWRCVSADSHFMSGEFRFTVTAE